MFIHRLLFFCCCLFIIGCTQNTQHLSDSLELALFGPNSPSISQDKINQIPYASIYVKQGDNPQALMVLAWAEPSSIDSFIDLKYLSANNEMLVTTAGRITKTVNLVNGNLTRLHSPTPDPLAMGLQHPDTPRFWEYYISWQPGYHTQYLAQSRFIVLETVAKTLPQGTRELIHVIEKVTIPAIKQHYINHYWLSPSSGEVVASEQTPAPGIDAFEIIIAKPFSGATQS